MRLALTFGPYYSELEIRLILPDPYLNPTLLTRHQEYTVPQNSHSRYLLSSLTVGRPEKLPDVCYSWWVLASLKIIGRLHWIDKRKLEAFILACQDDETGGFADRPGDMVS